MSGLSVVVPTHDTRELTLGCLASLAGGGAEETVVVDDGSTDGTAEAVARAHPEARVIRQEAAQGFTRAANRGLHAARGELLLLLNSDTEVEPGALAAFRAAFAAEPRLGVAGAVLLNPDGTPQWSGGRDPSLPWLFALASGLPGLLQRLPGYRRVFPLDAAARRGITWVSGAALVLRRAAWDELRPLDERFAFYGQDVDLCQRAAARGWRVAVVAAARVRHHGGATISRRPGALAGANPALLWADLVRLAGKRGGAAGAARAAFALRCGASLRLALRAVCLPFLAPEARERWRRDSELLRAAAAAASSALSA